MTATATKFLDSIREVWDSFDPWEATAQDGLSDYDWDTIVDMCEASGDDVIETEAQILAAIREKVAADAEKRRLK